MNRKPWSIIFFSVFLFLIPIFNILITYYLVPGDFAFSDYIYSLFALPSNRMALFSLTVPSLVSAYAVFSIKSWSLPVFFVAMLWILISSLMDLFLYFGVVKSIFLMVIPLVFNGLFIYFILIPNVRAAYLDPRLRWWETKPRYCINEKVEIKGEGVEVHSEDAMISNFSEGGIFLKTIAIMPLGIIVNLKFSVLGIPMNLNGKIVHQVESINAYGIQFSGLSRDEKKHLKKLTKELRSQNIPGTRPVVNWKEDLTKWIYELKSTGKGIIPDINKRR